MLIPPGLFLRRTMAIDVSLDDPKSSVRVRHSQRLRLALILLVTVTGCFYDPAMNVGVYSDRDVISARNTPEIAQQPVERSVVLQVPAGALESADGATLRVFATAGSHDPFPVVELFFGDPIDETMVVDSTNQYAVNYDMPVPGGCAAGCEFVIPVMITQVESGRTPTVSWSATFYFDYESPDPPEIADEMTVEILPADD